VASNMNFWNTTGPPINSTSPTSTTYATTTIDPTIDPITFILQNQKSSCVSKERALKWAQVDRDEDLKSFEHNLSAVFQPCLIIGCVLSVGLSIFLRLVILGCGHRNFRSAVVAVFIYSLMPMLTTMVVVENSEFLIGEKGLTCLNCVLKNIQSTESAVMLKTNGCNQLSEQHQKNWRDVIVTLSLKLLDGFGSSLILFIVLLRGKLRSQGHQHFWISLLRIIGTIVSFFTLIICCPLLFNVPAGWVFYTGYMTKLVPFADVRYMTPNALLVKKIMYGFLMSGTMIWTVIFATGIIYFSYKSWLFYRFSE